MFQLCLFSPPEPITANVSDAKARDILKVNPWYKKLRYGQKLFILAYIKQGLTVSSYKEESGSITVALSSRISYKVTPPKGCDISDSVWIDSQNREVTIYCIKKEQTCKVFSDKTYYNYPFSSLCN